MKYAKRLQLHLDELAALSKQKANLQTAFIRETQKIQRACEHEGGTVTRHMFVNIYNIQCEECGLTLGEERVP